VVIKLKYYNEIDCIIECPYDVLLNIQHYFTYMIKDFHVRKKYIKKWRFWNGKVKLVRVNKKNSFIPMGLVPSLIEQFHKIYGVEADNKIKNSLKNKNVTKSDIDNFLDNSNIPFKPYKHQREAVYTAVMNKKSTIVSPTSSGKSFFIYLFIKWFLENEKGKIIIIVPRIQLVDQMIKDFESYGYKGKSQKIYGGEDKIITERLIASTWQSIYQFDKSYFEQFNGIIFDECHSIKNYNESSSIITMLQKCKKAEYRMATTGTLDDSCELNVMQVEAIMGKVKTVTTMKELKDLGYVTPALIYHIQVNFPNNILETVNKLDYLKQVEFLEQVDPPNPFNLYIVDLALSLKGNTLILFNHIENGHGPFLYEQLLKHDTKHNENIFYIDGKKTLKERNKVIDVFNKNKNVIGVCSFGTFSTGLNIPSLENLIIGASTKSLFRTKQSVGRIIRKRKGKLVAYVYDFSSNTHYSFKHYMERKGYYQEDSHPVIEKEIDIKQVVDKLRKDGLI